VALFTYEKAVAIINQFIVLLIYIVLVVFLVLSVMFPVMVAIYVERKRGVGWAFSSILPSVFVEVLFVMLLGYLY